MFCASRKPSGRQEAVQLMRMMDDMLLKAGVDEGSEELKEFSQVRRQREIFVCPQFIFQISQLSHRWKVFWSWCAQSRTSTTLFSTR